MTDGHSFCDTQTGARQMYEALRDGRNGCLPEALAFQARTMNWHMSATVAVVANQQW